MKNALLILAIVAMFAACTPAKTIEVADTAEVVTDTVVFAVDTTVSSPTDIKK